MYCLILGSWEEQLSTTTTTQPTSTTTESTTRPTRPTTESTTRPTRPTTESTMRPTRPTTKSTTRPTRPTTELTTRPTRPTTEFTTQQAHIEIETVTEPQIQPSITTSTTTTTIEPTVEMISENEQVISHRPPANRPWWSEYHTQRPEQQQSCKPGSYQPSKDSCRDYYQCKNGRYRMYSCRRGLLWNRYTNKCDSSMNVNCNEPSKFCI